MIELTANISNGLVELLQAEDVILDAVEVGPWFSLEQIRQFQLQLPGRKFYFHHSNLIAKLNWIPGAKTSIDAYLQRTQTPWISFHYSLLPPGYVWFGDKFGVYPPPPDLQRANKWFIKGVEKLDRYNLPLLIENMPAFPTKKYAYETQAKNITEILAKTGANFLLDIAHARVVASIFDLEVHRYIESLPLKKIKQIHTSGVRTKQGKLFDAHEDLQEEDYNLLEWVLTQSNPEVVTLEYYKDKEKLHQQLVQIQQILERTHPTTT